MSGDQPSRFADDEIRTPKFTNEQKYNSEQNSIDQRFKRLREEVLPFYPFLLTVPTDVPFRLGSRFVNNWAVSNDGPFTPEEQQLQYMTFLTHHEGDSLLVAVGDWSDATGNVMSDQRSGAQSAASTPSHNSVKKKISLNDYRNRRKSGTSASPIGHEAANHVASVFHSPDVNQRVAKASFAGNDLRRPAEKPHSVQSRAVVNTEGIERKRPFEINQEPSRSQQKGAMPSKKPRTSPDPAKVDRLKGNGLPALLSPTLPPTSSSPRLPRLLSPTLPPDIEKELARVGEGFLGLGSSQPGSVPNIEVSSVSKVQKARSALHASPQLDLAATFSSHSKQPHHGYDKRPPSSADISTNDASLPARADLQAHMGQTTQRLIGSPPAQQATSARSQLVKLKYGRSNRKRIEALLKFSGKRKSAPPSSPVKNALDIEPSHSSKVRQAAAKAPPSGRQDHNKSQRLEWKGKHMPTTSALSENSKIPDKSQTPVPYVPNAVVNPPDRQKPSSLTPVKDIKSSASRLDPSSGNDARPSYHAAAKRPGNSATPSKCSSPQPSNMASRQCDRRAWKDENQRYANLGRELKHAAERHTAKDHVTATDEKLAAATAIEAILCFILAFVADDQFKALSRQAADSSSWLSILAYWRVVKKNSALYPRLYSLCLILGAISYDAIHALDLERLAATPLPGENTPVPTPGSDGTAAPSEEQKKNRRELLELKNRLPECYKESQKLWLEGSRGLSEEVLAREFPNTWSKRSKNFSELGKHRLKAGEYSGEFYLPVGRINSPLEIIRFSHAFLSEWCMKEGVRWSNRLKL